MSNSKQDQDRWVSVLNALPQPALCVGAHGDCRFANRRWQHIIGQTADAARGQGWWPAVHPEDLDALLTAAAGPEAEAEIRLQTAGGEYRWFKLQVSLMGDDASALRLASFTDVEAHRRIERRLEESQSRKDAILDSALDAIISIDHEGRVVEFNRAAEQIFGYERAEALGRRMSELIVPPRLRRGHEAGLRAFLATGRGHIIGRHVELPAIRRDGVEFPAEIAIVRVEGVEPPLFTGFIRDLTERKRAEQALRESEERQRLALKAARGGWWSWEVAADRIEWGGDTLRLYGFSDEQPPRSYDDFESHLYLKDRQRVRNTTEASMASGEPYEAEFRVLMPDGATRWLIGRGDFIRDDQGTPIRLLGVTVDITDRKEAEEALRQINATLEQRVQQRTALVRRQAEQLRLLVRQLAQAEQHERRRIAAVLHDHFQQILAAAKMRLDVLRPRVDQSHRPHLDVVDRLITDAIGESRSLAVELSPPVLYERGLVPALDWLARQFADTHRLAVQVEAQPQTTVPQEEVRSFLFQSVRELLFNVVKHSGTRDATVRVAREAEGVAVVVEDRGRGCEADAVLADPGEDRGFGLFSIRQRIELLGGSFDLATEPGRGCRATMWVPRNQKREGSPLDAV